MSGEDTKTEAPAAKPKQGGVFQPKIILMSAGIGILRGLIGFPVEQPLESMKTQWQAKPALKNELAVFKDIKARKGINGFYAGSIPNFTRMVLKNIYRYPLMISLPHFYE
jgi:hypothetical protein